MKIDVTIEPSPLNNFKYIESIYCEGQLITATNTNEKLEDIVKTEELRYGSYLKSITTKEKKQDEAIRKNYNHT